jgi:uncharacterized membrane protein YecN with MAPEG domain
MIVFMLCAGLLGLLATGLTINVGRLRSKKRIFLGDGGDPELVSAIRAQGNLIELTPLCLLLIYLLAGPYGHRIVAALAVILLVARLLHAGGMLGLLRYGRAAGAISTTVVLAAVSILLALVGLGLQPF